MRLAYSTFFGLKGVEVAGPGFVVRAMRADPDRIVQPHVHDGAHVVAILRGKYLSMASPSAPLRAADIVYNPHGVEHADTFDGEDGSFLTVSFDPGHYPPSPGESATPVTLNRPKALAAIYGVLAHLKAPKPCDPQAFEPYVLALADCGIAPEAYDASHAPPRWALAARAELRTGKDAVSVAKLASAQGMHPVAFSRAFRRYFGASPLAFAMESRLRNAAQDLAAGRAPIAQIGLKWGFFDQAHFNRQFIKRFGAAPGTFRRTFQS